MYIKRRDKENNFYRHLQNQSLEMIQRLSGERWTDFNEHDPGVTLLDILNYALLELSYQLEAPFETYLVDSGTKDFCYEQAGLIPPQKIFEPVVVAPPDYESLVIKIAGVKNCRVIREENSFYTFILEPAPNGDPKGIRAEVESLYHSHRNLCENLGEIRFEKLKEKAHDSRKQFEPFHFETVSQKIQLPKTEQTPYRSIQYELPDCYGINERGLPPEASMKRKMEALQLKAYLLIYDYMISGICQQAGNINQLLELSGKMPAQFRTEVEIEDLNKLLDIEKIKQQEVFDPKEMLRQKSGYFDYLDMLYGEDTHPYAVLDPSPGFRAGLIRRFPEFNTLRFRSFNLLDEKIKSITGIELLLNTLFNYDPEKEERVPEYCKFCSLQEAFVRGTHLFYFVEHILLRDEYSDTSQSSDDSNKLSIVVSHRADQLRPKAREIYLKVFEERLPAHLDIQCLWLGEKDLKSFVRSYYNWRKAWAKGDNEQIEKFSEEIRILIEG
ncbi:MAG: hypothetical protein LBU57_07745 [Dysgonamonadaceae bacterium]|nr:hypothetical protein [Dysgonamonadaceae bacterium]